MPDECQDVLGGVTEQERLDGCPVLEQGKIFSDEHLYCSWTRQVPFLQAPSLWPRRAHCTADPNQVSGTTV